MRKCTNISPYMRRPLVIYNFATPSFVNFLISEKNKYFLLSVNVAFSSDSKYGNFFKNYSHQFFILSSLVVLNIAKKDVTEGGGGGGVPKVSCGGSFRHLIVS
jgi:hypothetical protein